MKALRWAAPVLLVVEVVLVLRGQLSFGVAAVVFLTVEAALILAAVTQAAVAVRAYRASRLSAAPGRPASTLPCAQHCPDR